MRGPTGNAYKAIVFLDIDGVLNSARWYTKSAGSRSTSSQPTSDRELWSRSFDPASVERLNGLLERTGAVVILSSSWRKTHALSEIIEIMEEKGFRGEIAGATPTSDGARIDEITTWLKNNDAARTTPWVIIDDNIESGFPVERVVSPSSETGLTDKDVARAIDILTGQVGQTHARAEHW